MRILVADDDQDLVRALGRWLTTWGYEPVIAHDGLEALRILKGDDAPSVCLLDWDMPPPTGIEICRVLRTMPHRQNIYVVMLTARQHKTDVVEALESGADDFLSKPFHPRELQLRLAKGVREASLMPPAPIGDTLVAGAVLGGKVRLEREIGRGGMGSVWLGVHLSLGVNVAVKFMDRTLAETADYASFDREARAAAQLRSEHIVRIYDHGIARDGLPYLVMEYLDGESLHARIGRLGRLPAEEVIASICDVARALGDAHARGIVHRDVKPENIIRLEEPERVQGFSCKLIDFGLARAGQPTDKERHIAGTPFYMSPEYLRRDVAPNPALDLWALAVSTFEALTGTLPFAGESPAHILEKIYFEPHPRASKIFPDIPAAFDQWFARACSKEPKDRFATANELANELAFSVSSALATQSVPVIPIPPPPASHEHVTAPTEPDPSSREPNRDRDPQSSPR